MALVSYHPFVLGWLFLVCSSGVSSPSASLTLTYLEGDSQLFNVTQATHGCYSDLQAYPHWCLGNITQCQEGISVMVWLKALTDPTPEDKNDIILTSGGHSANGNGYYIIRSFGDQYSLGVAAQDRIWTTTLRLLSGSWILLGFSWKEDEGLKVYVDGLLQAETQQAQSRAVSLLSSSTASSIQVGLDEAGDPDLDSCTYLVSHISVVNSSTAAKGFETDSEVTREKFQGCIASTFEEQYALDAGNIDNPALCRLNCHQDGKTYALIKNETSCACTDDVGGSTLAAAQCRDSWEVYLVSGVQRSHNYGLRLSYRSLSRNQYTKPMEDFLFNASVDYNIDLVYRFQFDDGVIVTTTSSPVSHSWISAGTHDVTVSTSIGIVPLTANVQVLVEDVDEGQAPALVGLTAEHETQSRMALFTLRVVDEHSTTCTLTYGDGSGSTSHAFTQFGASVQVQYEYSICGLYFVNAHCSNLYGNTSNQIKFLAREFHEGHHYISDIENFTIPIFGDFSFLDSLSVLVDGTDIQFEIKEDSGDTWVLVSADDLEVGTDNVVSILSDGVVVDRHVLAVRRRVSVPQILASRTSNAWSLTAQFAFSLQPSDHVWVAIDFGNGDEILQMYAPEIETLLQTFENSFYGKLGDYNAKIALSNEISNSSSSLDLSVEVPIEYFSLSTQNITTLSEDAVFVMDINPGTIGPQKVVFTINYGDGKTDTVLHKNDKVNGFEPLVIFYRYATWGIYHVNVRAANNISNSDQHVLIHVGENMTFLDILTEQERVHVDGTLDFLINCPTGSDVLYTINFGDGDNYTVGELSGAEPSSHSSANQITEEYIVVTHYFSKSGNYNASVVASNEFGVIRAELCPTIAVDEPSSFNCSNPIVDFKDMDTTLEQPFVSKRSMATAITVEAESGCNSTSAVMTYSWKGVTLVPDNNGTLTEKSIYSYCRFQLLDNTLIIEPRSLPFGLYKLTVTVSRIGDDVSYTSKDFFLEIIQSEPVPLIEGDEVRTIMLYATAIFDISGSHDPDLVVDVRKDLSLHLFFMPEMSLKEAKLLSFYDLESRSEEVANSTLFRTTTANPFYMYQFGRCFNETSNMLTDISFFNGKITFAADQFVIDQFSFGIILWAERNNLTAMTSQIVEVRSSNMSLDDLGSLLDLAENADPDTAIRLLGGAASAILNQDVSSAEAQDKLAESTEAVVNTLGSVAKRIDSPNQAAKCASTIKTMTSNKDIVSEGSRSSAAGAFVDLANGTSAMEDATVDDASNLAGEALGGLANIFPTSQEEKKGPRRRSKDDEVTTTTTELLSRMANGSDSFGYTTPFTLGNGTTTPSTGASNTTTTSTATTTTTTTSTTSTTTTTTPVPTTITTTTVTTTPTTTIIHTTVGTTLSPSIRASFSDNGDNFTISGITLATLYLNASGDFNYTTSEPFTTTPMTTTTTPLPTTTPVTIPIHPRMFDPRTDERTSYELAEEILNGLPEKETYDELLDYIFDDCLLFRKIMITPDIQYNCPCISAEAVNLMKCSGDFTMQDRVFDIMTYYEHPDDLYEAYLVPLNIARKARDKARRETDKQVAGAGQQALGTVADTVGDKTPADDATERAFETPRLGMKLAKVGVNNGTNGTESGSSKQNMAMPVGGFDMPTDILKGAAGDCPNVNTMFMGDTDNPYTFSEESSNVGKGVLSLGYSCNGQKVAVEDAAEPILLWMDRDANSYDHGLFVLLTNTKKDVWTNFNYHPVNITDKNGSLQVVLEPTDELSEYYVYMKYGDRPNMTHYDFIGSSPNEDVDLIEGFSSLNDTQKDQLRYTVTIPLELTSENGTYWLGIKFKSGNLVVEEQTANTSYTLLNLVSGCRFWDETNDTWSSEGCEVGPLTTKYKTQCFCTHLTSFGSDAAVAPNTIDFSNVWAKFGNLSENAAVFSTVISLIGLYVILLIWLRYMDKKDIVKWGAMPLEDNLPTDSYHYQITIQTGVKKNSGTDSQVRFILSGEETDTGVRRLVVADGQRKHLPAGSILNYVLSVEANMGPLTFLRIWHDNGGKGKNKSWFLDQVQVTDLQTGEKFIFLCNRWLAVEQDDGMVDRILPVAGLEDLVAFKQLFSSSARKKLANDHLWVSVFSRPTRSNFTRVQRLSCCMSLLFLTMITNAMWFKGDSDEKKVEAITLGPFSFTLAQFFISFASTLIVFPVNFIMMTFFRRCRPKDNAVGQVNQKEIKDKQKFRWKNVTSSSMVWGPRAKKGRMRKLKESVSNILSFHKQNKYTDPEPEPKDDDERIVKPKKKKPWSVPHWCIYIAWILCFFSIVASGFFTILYSMEWGKEKANEWLTTFLLSFFQSVIIVQPIKVLLLVAFIACILKKPDLDEEDLDEDINKVLAGKEASAKRDEASLSQIMLQRRSDNTELQPPDPEQLAKSREGRLMEIKMEAVLKEIAVYTLFLAVIFFLSYQQRDPQSYQYGVNVRNFMLNGFDKIKTVKDYWIWVEGTFMPALYALQYANDTPVHYWQDAACVQDMESRRVGVARFRQMRVKNDTCNIYPTLKPVINHCRDEYSWTDDDTKPYFPYWVKPPKSMEEKLKETESPFVYQNSIKLKTAPYVGNLATYKGGGYVILTKRLFCRTKVIMSRAKAQNWLDLNTKAIFLEYTIYNPNTNLFASVTAVIEFLTTGSATNRVEVKIFRLMSYIGGFGLVVLLVEVVFGIVTLYFFYRCIVKLRKDRLKYFNDFWNLLEFVLLCFAVTCIVLYAFKHILTDVAMAALHNRESDGFVNFNSIALYDEMYGYIMAVVVYLATIQFLKLLQFNKKMGMLGSTIKLASKDLKVFSITFFLYFFAFTATGYLLFGHAMPSYQSVVTASESMFAFALGSFDYEAMTTTQPFWGPLFFFSYIGVMYIGLMSIFLTIIGDAFTTVKEDVALQSNDYEIVEFMWKKIKGLFA